MKCLIFNPEPEELREDNGIFQSRVFNETVNFAANTGHQIPLLQLIPPANTYAIAHDHDYCELSPEGDFLCEFNVQNIDEKSARTQKKKKLVCRRNKKVHISDGVRSE